MRLIGWKWKCSDTWSGPVLIGRGFNHNKLKLVITLFSFERATLNQIKMSGDYSEMATPVPIPNTEVKHFSAEGSTTVQE